MVYVGIDLHKKSAQVAAADKREKSLMNRKIPHTRETIRYEASYLHKHAKYVIESSSVWEGTYRCMTEELGLDMIVSNPYTMLLIAKSKKKTDKADVACWRTCSGAISFPSATFRTARHPMSGRLYGTDTT